MRTPRLALLVLGMALISASSAQAQTEPRASDGQTLSTQPSATQDLFRSVWGSSAAIDWVTEHDGTLGTALPHAATPASPAPVFISMNNHDQFAPAALTVPLGSPVTWRNDDTDPHTVTGDPAKSFPGVKVVAPAGVVWDSGLVPANQTFTYTFTTPGHYIYICTVHAGSGMVATIDVVG